MDEFTQPEKAPQRTAWLLIFTDLLSLMLTFFVLLFAMSEVKIESWRAVVAALSERSFPIEMSEERQQPDADRNVAKVASQRAMDLGYLNAVLTEKIGNEPLARAGAMRRLGDRLVLSLPARDLFVAGGARLTATAYGTARMLADLLQTIRNRIEIYVHVQPGTERGGGFVSSWELSLAQAGMLARALRESGYGPEIPVFGLADSRFYDISADLSDERRRALAHRVDLVIYEPDD